MALSPAIWITSNAAVQRLRGAGIQDPKVLWIWAQDGFVRSSAAVERIAGAIQKPPAKPNLIHKGFWGELADYPVFVDWVAGIFETWIDVEHEYGWQHASWRMTGVKFASNDIDLQLGMAPSPNPKAKGFQKASLPANAKPADKKYAPAAHNTAKLMQTKGLKKPEALRKSQDLFTGGNIDEKSVIRGIRRSFDRMYDDKGYPI